MRKWLILLSALSATSVLGAPAWTWVDTDGQVHYSDRPVPGAKQVELAGAQAFGAPQRQAPASGTRASSGAAAAQAAAAQATAYRTFNIVSPMQQEMLWNTGSTVTVRIALEPNLQPNHRLDVLIDGERRNLNVTTTALSVPDVFRGVHTVEAVIIDQNGGEVLRSLSTSFMVQQTSIQNPSNAQAPSRPPQAQPKRGGN